MKYTYENEKQLLEDILGFADDPLEYVLYVFPWGQEGTPLENFEGPRRWQAEILVEIGNAIKENRNRMRLGLPIEVYNAATVSGRGIGKSALVAMLNHWHVHTHLGATAITTANTEQQLRSRTWPEVGKWHTMAINNHWFEHTATALKPHKWFAELVKEQLKIDPTYWYANAQTWSEENSVAFAGAHSMTGMMLIFDEASGIHSKIWEVSEGFFTEPILYRFWLAFSNGRQNTGSFFECFNRHRDHWRRRHIDSRTVEGIDRAVFDKIIDKYGADSDQARVEVYGKFPRTGERQFISTSIVREATNREYVPDTGPPLMMGVDVARFGDDRSVIRFRQGRSARKGDVPGPFRYKGLDNMQLAYEVADKIDKYNPDAVCIDAGNGTGVIDRLKELGYSVHEIQFGARSPDREYANFRTYIWGRLRDWLSGGCIDPDAELETDLTGPEYEFVGSDGDQLRLEPKEKMKKRGLASPDDGDALALTFAVRASRRDTRTSRHRRRVAMARDVEYDVLG